MMVHAPDSAGAIAAARRAQRRFEGVRRAALPIQERRGGSPCEVHLGRYCYWYDSTSQPPVPREGEGVTMARHLLLAALDSLGAVSPADAWIVGQRVRYRLDALDTAGAVINAESACHVTGWWCDALRGYALHFAGEHDAAGRAFDRALAAMGEEDRCAWENPAAVLPRPARDHVQGMACDERRAAASRLWWLASPQLGRAGNDVRTEFFARRVESLLEEDARLIYAVRSSWDTNELLLRYGGSSWWTRERSMTISGPSEPQLVGHGRSPAFNFLPSPRAVLDAGARVRNADWQPSQPTPAMRYAPSYLAWWRDGSAQVARLRRGDTLLVIAAFEAPDDSMLGDPVAQLVLSPGPGRMRFASRQVHALRGVLEVRMPRAASDGEVLASVEIVDHPRRAMARHREIIGDTGRGRLALSDLLLHRPLAQPPAVLGLDAVLADVLPATSVAAERVGVYWETYGVAAAGELLDVALTIERLDAPWMRRAAARLGLADRITPVHIRWQESPRADGGAPARSMAVSLANLANGEYRVTLRVRGDDGAEAVSQREVRVRR